jgi:hypothetical protein
MSAEAAMTRPGFVLTPTDASDTPKRLSSLTGSILVLIPERKGDTRWFRFKGMATSLKQVTLSNEETPKDAPEMVIFLKKRI